MMATPGGARCSTGHGTRGAARARRERSPCLRPGARLRAGLLVAFLALGAGPAGALTVLPGEAFEVPFSFTAPPQSALGDVDVVAFLLAGSSTASGVLGYRVELWDGATLIGAHHSSGLQLWAFTTSTTAWSENPLVVDLSSVVDGSIDGRLRVIPEFDPAASGAHLEAVFFPVTGLKVGTGLSDGISLVEGEPAPVVGSSWVAAVPEPGAAGLLLLGASLVLTRHAREHPHRPGRA